MIKFFMYGDHIVTRGSEIKNIYQPFCRSGIRHKSSSIRICIIWNSLTQDVVEVSSLNIFKNRLDMHLCKRAFCFHNDSDYAHTFKDLLFRADIKPFDLCT